MEEIDIIDVDDWDNVPSNFTGMVHYHLEGKNPAAAIVYWHKEGKWHREDGPAVEYSNGSKSWYLEGIYYPKIVLKDFIILGYDKGKYGIVWYRLLDKDKIFEYPDIPGLIIRNDVSGAALDSDRARDYV